MQQEAAGFSAVWMEPSVLLAHIKICTRSVQISKSTASRGPSWDAPALWGLMKGKSSVERQRASSKAKKPTNQAPSSLPCLCLERSPSGFPATWPLCLCEGLQCMLSARKITSSLPPLPPRAPGADHIRTPFSDALWSADCLVHPQSFI